MKGKFPNDKKAFCHSFKKISAFFILHEIMVCFTIGGTLSSLKYSA